MNIQTPKGKVLADHILQSFEFYKALLRKPSGVSAIKPTSKKTANHMASFVPLDCELPVLELGPGTGVITQALIDLGMGSENITSIEYDLSLYNYLKKKFTSVNFIHGDAFDLLNTLGIKQLDGTQKKFSSIICAVPLVLAPSEKSEKMIFQGLNLIPKGRPLIAISYSKNPPVKSVSGKFKVESAGKIVQNLPPARIWAYYLDQ